MPIPYTIRPIWLEEVEEARRLIYSVARDQFHPEMSVEEASAFWDAQGVLSDMADVRRSYLENGGVFWVMVVDGRIVGTGGFHRSAEEATCEMRRLYLLPSYQGHGLGYAMLAALIDRARAMGYRRMTLLTDRKAQSRAVDFYRRIGFVESARQGKDEDDLRMEMEIAP